MAIELAEECEGAKLQLSESSASYLWLCCFIDSFVDLADFSAVIRFVESWSASMRGEVEFVEKSLSYPKCQVVNFVSRFVVCVCPSLLCLSM